MPASMCSHVPPGSADGSANGFFNLTYYLTFYVYTCHNPDSIPLCMKMAQVPQTFWSLISIGGTAISAPAVSAASTASLISSTRTYGRTTGASSSRIGGRMPTQPPFANDAVRAPPNIGSPSQNVTSCNFECVATTLCLRLALQFRGSGPSFIFVVVYDV